MRYGDRPYFLVGRPVCAIQATKAHVNLFLYDPDVADPEGLITDGFDNATARQTKIPPGTFPDRVALLRLLGAIAERNRAGGWRTLRDQPG